MRKSMKKLLFLFVSVCMMISMCAPAMAAEENAVKNVGDGVLRLTMYYEAKDGTEVFLRSGSCFLLNEKTVLTNYSLIHLGDREDDKEIKEHLEENYGADFSNAAQVSKKLKFYVAVRRDMRNEAVIMQNVTSEEIDMAVLTLSEPINGRKPVTLGDSDNVREIDNVYSLGFETGSILVQDTNLFTKDDIDIQSGIISKPTEVGTIPVFQHTASVKPGTFGGPLVDANGYIIGLNSENLASVASARTGSTGAADGKNDYAVQINEIKAALDPYSIVYSVASEEPAGAAELPTPETAATEPPVDEELENAKADLKDAIAAAKEADLSLYSDDSVKAYEDAIADAERVLDGSEDADEVKDAKGSVASAESLLEEKVDEALEQAKADLQRAVNSAESYKADQDSYTESSYTMFESALADAETALASADATAESLNLAKELLEERTEELEEKKGIDTMLIVIIAIAAVVVIILIVVIVMVAKSSGKKKKTVTHPGTETIRSTVPNTPAPHNPTVPHTPDPAPPTGILSQDAGETAILNGGGTMGNASLTRVKNGEKIVITSTHFAIGREMGKVNYCITDNTTVGRVHAVIVKKGNDYYLIDQKSTNGTYVNNQRLTAGEERKLNDGDQIILSDEKMKFVQM